MKRKLILLCAFLLAHGLSSGVHAAEHREHGPHEHGAANLNVAVDGHQLSVELMSPAVNIVGFEHAPATVDERARIEQAVAILEDGTRLYVLPPEARCQLQDTDVDSELLGEHHEDHEAHHDKEHHEGHGMEKGEAHHEHSEFHATHIFRCEQPGALTSMEVNLFTLFPGTHRLAVQYITPRSQGGAELHPGRSRLSF